MYMMWFDDNAKKEQVTKIAEAVEAYKRHFLVAPNLVLVNPEEVVSAPGVTVRPASYVRRFNIWVGFDDPASLG